MTTPAQQPARADSGKPTAHVAALRSQADEFAASPAIGPIPAIYVPQSPGQTTTLQVLPQHAVTGAARLTHGWAAGRNHHASMGETMTDLPADLRYSEAHLWVRSSGTSLVRVGVTGFAQQSLGDVVDVTRPGPGGTVNADEPCGDIGSVKSLNDLIAPVTGTVRARNDDLTRQGWMLKGETDPAALGRQLAALMDARAYRKLAGE